MHCVIVITRGEISALALALAPFRGRRRNYATLSLSDGMRAFSFAVRRQRHRVESAFPFPRVVPAFAFPGHVVARRRYHNRSLSAHVVIVQRRWNPALAPSGRRHGVSFGTLFRFASGPSPAALSGRRKHRWRSYDAFAHGWFDRVRPLSFAGVRGALAVVAIVVAGGVLGRRVQIRVSWVQGRVGRPLELATPNLRRLFAVLPLLCLRQAPLP
jgi:hypothetical protein